MRVKLKSVYLNTKKKDGTPYINKNGEPFKMAVITSELGNKASKYLGVGNEKAEALISSWKAGDEVEVEITKSGVYNNFDLPGEKQTF